MEGTGIGTGIRIQRERLGMSQQDLAQACMVSRQTISNWETGKTLPDIQSMAYLAEVFGVTVDDLVNQVAPELGKRVSVDKRELLRLTLGIIFIGVLYIRWKWCWNGRMSPLRIFPLPRSTRFCLSESSRS